MLTASTITDEHINRLRDEAAAYGNRDLAWTCDVAQGRILFNDIGRTQTVNQARWHLADLLNTRAAKETK